MRLAALVLLAVISVANLTLSSPVRFVGQDFVARYAAGQVIRDGGDPYDERSVFPAQAALADEGGDFTGQPLRILDPPATLIPFRALAHLPLRAAAWTWWALSVMALAGLAVASARLVGFTQRATRVTLLAAGIFGPALTSLSLGQIDIVLLLPLFAGLLLARTGRQCAPAVAILSLLKPQIALLPVLALLWEHRRRPTAWAEVALTAGAVVIAAATILPLSAWRTWFAQLGEDNSAVDIAPWAAVALALFATAGAVLALRLWRRSVGALDRASIGAAATGLFGGLVRWNPQWMTGTAFPLMLAARRGPSVALALACALLLPGGLTGGGFSRMINGVGDVQFLGELLATFTATVAVAVLLRVPPRFVVVTLLAHAVARLLPLSTQVLSVTAALVLLTALYSGASTPRGAPSAA